MRLLFQVLVIIFVKCFVCSSFINAQNKTYSIAFSKATNSQSYQAYTKWIKSGDSLITCVNLYGKKPLEAAFLLEQCSGLVLTGGPDVNPAYYSKANDSVRCEMDYYRDSLEFALIQKAMQMQIPVLAICRGEQILNVYMSGDLIVDIPDDYDTLVKHRSAEGYGLYHGITINENSLLFECTAVKNDSVNSYHHQAVGKLAACFVATAHSADGIVEAYEWKYKPGKPFLIAVQFHPERMAYSEISRGVLNTFLNEVKKYAAP